jgi:HK97 family phage prohead protease
MAISDKERVSEGSWDGSAGRFTDSQYESSCVLDRKVCGGEWADKPPKTRCSLPIKEPGGEINRAGVHAAAARINQVDACPQAIASAKAKLRSAYKSLGEDPPDSLSSSKGDAMKGVYRDRALASLDHEWEFRDEKPKEGFLGTLNGHFAVFNRWTEIDSPFEGHFLEQVAPGAFTKTFAEGRKNMRCLVNHGHDPRVGMMPLGPIRTLEEDTEGAYYEVDLLDTSYNRDLVPGLKAEQFGASFRFQIRREEFSQHPERTDHNPGGIPESIIREAKVKEFGPVTFPQYEEASAGLRSINDELIGLDLTLMARSDPKVVADFARILSVSIPYTVKEATTNASANVGTNEEQRNDPTDVDPKMETALQSLKDAIAKAQDLQDTDPDRDDPDDDDVSDALDDAAAAIERAISAQSKDSEEENEDDSTEDESEDGRDETSPEDEKTRAPADRAPVRGPTAPGATLRKRAALLTHRTDKEPTWKL